MMLIISLWTATVVGYFKVPLERQNNRFLLRSGSPHEILQLSFDPPDFSLPVVDVTLDGLSVEESWLHFLLESIFISGKEQRSLTVQASVVEVRHYRVHLFNITKQLVEPIFSIYFNPFTKSFELHLQGFSRAAIGFFYQAEMLGDGLLSEGLLLEWNTQVKNTGKAIEKVQKIRVDGNLKWLQLSRESLQGVIELLGECWMEQFLKCKKSVLQVHQIELYFKGVVRIPLYRLVLHYYQQTSVFEFAVKPALQTTFGLQLFEEYYAYFDLGRSEAAFLRSSLVKRESRMGIYAVRVLLLNVFLLIVVSCWMQRRGERQAYRRVDSLCASEK